MLATTDASNTIKVRPFVGEVGHRPSKPASRLGWSAMRRSSLVDSASPRGAAGGNVDSSTRVSIYWMPEL
jgi:hypothetical protein